MRNHVAMEDRRTALLRLAIKIEAVSIAWILVETIGGSFAALQVHSLSISAFSLDSGVELLSGFVLFIRLFTEYVAGRTNFSKAVERGASGVVGVCLFSLAGFIAWSSGRALAGGQSPDFSVLGLMIAAISSVITPWLARAKYRLGSKLHSHALLGDAACSMTCAYMAWTLMIGMLVQWSLGWWWMDSVVALGILYFVLREAWESVDAFIHGEAHLHAH